MTDHQSTHTDMATYGAVVPLMQDLRWLLSSFDRIFGYWEFFGLPEWKQGVRSLYENVSLMNSLLRDSTAESCYDPGLIKRFENRITDVVHRAGSYVHLNISDFLEKQLIIRDKDTRLLKRDFLSIRLMGSLLRDSTAESYHSPQLIRVEQIADFVHTVKILSGFTYDYERSSVPDGTEYAQISCIISRGLERINQEIACINEELQKTFTARQRTRNFVEDDASSIAGKSFTVPNTSQRSQIEGAKLVGLENDLVKMLDCLTSLPLKLQLFAVTGMAGIGKTAFTRKLYEDPLVRHHFYVHAWVSISQHYRVKEILLGLLSCVTNLSDEMYECSHEQLRERVYQCLKGKRYLIILDDMWDDKDWNDLRMTFPDDKNGSRIILTSGLTNVAFSVSPDNPPHHMQCLSQDESWELLCSRIFVNQSCPQELIKIGKQISCRCQGLPLAIVVVGGLLSKMEKTLKVWEEVEQSVGSLVMKDTQHCENILALSYDHLPDPLKACFLYMGLFQKITTSLLRN